MSSKLRLYTRRFFWLHLLLALGVAGFLTIYFLTEDSPTFRLGDCFVRDHLGMYCPGCGGSRGMVLFLTGHPIKAFEAYPAYLFALLAFLWCDGCLLVSHIKKTDAPLRYIRLWMIFIPLAVAMIWAPLRTYFAHHFGYDPLGDLTQKALVFLAPR
jgi:hypothetical protein